jgi:putative membrane protein
MGERLHPAAVAVYTVEALRQAAVPLMVIFGVSLFGGGFDSDAATRAVVYGAISVVGAGVAGLVRWSSTTWSMAGEAVRLRKGILSVNEVEVPFARVQAIDVQQGPIQRLFGVEEVHVQTGGGGSGGEIVLGAVDPRDVVRLRTLVERRTPIAEQQDWPQRRLTWRQLGLAALTSGQLGVILPLLAGAGGVAQQLVKDPVQGEHAVEGLLPGSTTGWLLAAAAVLALAWVLAALSTIIAFAGFTIRREGDVLRIRRGLLQRREATLRIPRVRAVHVIEGVPRQPLGLAALRVEVIGYAKEPHASQTVFPLLRRDAVEGFLDELLPELSDRLGGLAAPPPHALRRYLLPPAAASLIVAVAAAVALSSPFPLAIVILGPAYGLSAWRAAGWRLGGDGRLAIRSRMLARTTVLAPARHRESHDIEQTALQRRARLAHVSIAFGKRTNARIRHLDLDVAHELWADIAQRWGAPPDVRGGGSPYGRAMTTSISPSDSELKARHRKMWASGDYPSMVETWLTPLGRRLAGVLPLGPGTRVLDIAAGTGNASIPAALTGAHVTATDLTPELLEAGRERAAAAGVELDWQTADAEHLPFEDGSFDVVMSAIGVMFAPHHQIAADELLRVCRPGGTIGLLSWTPEGMIGALFRTIGPFAPAPPPGASPPPLWGGEDHLRELLGDRAELSRVTREKLEATAFERPHDFATHFKDRYGPTIVAQNNARANGREDEFVAALDAFTDEWNLGTADEARFELEYLLTVATRH